MITPPSEHIKQLGPQCAFAAAAMSCGHTQEDFDGDVIGLGGRYSLGSFTLPDLAPFLYLHGLVFGPLPSFSVEPVEEQQSTNTTCISVNKSSYYNICQLAEREHQTPENFIENLFQQEFVRRGYSTEKCNFSEENGLQKEELNIKKIAGFRIEVSIEQPAIVAVNTDKNSDAGHAVYWSGEKLYDPNLDYPQANFDNYSIRQWVPLIRTDPPLPGIIDYLKRRKQLDGFKAQGQINSEKRGQHE